MHPREPHDPAVDHPSGDRVHTLPGDLGELGTAEEEAAKAADEQAQGATEVEADADDAPGEVRRRNRKTWKDTGEGPAHYPDWSQLNANTTLRALATGTDAAKSRLIRKLHLR